ncbi:MAG: cation:proton antiporter [Clostridia bacterium]|nr:cation:proton antiporter [Clostridia bacterium]MDY2714420.1 cation:proton antiporter [Christensenellaceae bacterium]
MEIINIFYYLAVILLLAKSFGLLARKIGLPQVTGMVVAGLLIGFLKRFNNPDNFFLSFFMNPDAQESEVLHAFSQVGVVLILFSSGLETKLSDLKKSGLAATVIAFAGVITPILFGTLGAMAFLHGYSEYSHDKLLNAIFVGTILAATSVGITVETLKELGKLNGKVGQTVISAAVIDDVIGIIALSIVTSLKGNGAEQIGITLLKAVGFFAFAIGLGILLRIYFNWEERKFPHKRRTSIFAFAMCFFYAYCSEKFFGIASITGAYVAGIMISGLDDTPFVDRKAVVSGYMIFTPIFFAYIGISADFSSFSLNALWFGLAFVALGIAGKIIGCSLAAKPFGFTNKESLTVGCGMIARGEVALAVYSAGQSLIAAENGLDPLLATIMLILISSIVCPILLKLLFKDKRKSDELPLDNPPAPEQI